MSKLIEMTEKFPQSELWTDSFHVEDHEYGLLQGSKGITTSPTWVSKMMTNEALEGNAEIIRRLHEEDPDLNEIELAWRWTLERGKERSRIMLPLFETGKPKQGRFSIQTSIYEYNSYLKMLQMAREVDACGSNMQVKIPCTEGGIRAIEEATYEGISCMGTQCFSIDQALAAAEAVERAYARRKKEGLSNETINPMIALLPGMQDETLKSHCDRLKLVVHPDALNWGGIAVAKKTINILKERKYRIRPLIAYYRSYLHWSQFIGADCAQTIPVKWQKSIENCDIKIRDYFNDPVEEWKIEELMKLPLFCQVYEEGSLKPEDFVRLEPVVNTFRYFTSEYQKAVNMIRDICLPEFK